MKICLVSNLFNPYIIGGAEINVERLAEALSKENDVSVVSACPFKNFFSLFPRMHTGGRIKIYRFYPLNIYSVYSAQRRKIPAFLKILWHVVDLFNLHSFFVVLHILKKEKPEVIHAHNLDGLSFSVFWAAKLRKIRLVHTLHDYHLLCPYANFLCPYAGSQVCKERPLPCKVYSFLKRVVVDNIPQGVIGPSAFIIDLYRKYGFFKKTVVRTIPYFVDAVPRDTPARGDKKTFDILYLGRLSPEKGVDALIRVFRGLREDFLRLHIVGEGKQHLALEKIAAGDTRIIFHGKVSPAGAKEHFQKADVLAVPSLWYENFPTVVLEAFSWGVPVIGARTGGITEQIVDGYNGLLFERGDRSDLEKKLKLLIEDFGGNRSFLKLLRENAYACSRKYTEENVLPQLMSFYSPA